MEKYVRKDEELQELLKQQEGKSFYIPSVQEVEEFFAELALLSVPEYQKLLTCLVDKRKMDKDHAVEFGRELWNRISRWNEPQEAMQWFVEQMESEDKSQNAEVMALYMNVANNTRMLTNRGGTLSEVFLCDEQRLEE